MSYHVPEKVQLYNLKTAVLDHVTVYTDDPLPGEMKPPPGQLFAYYRVDDETTLYRIPLGMQMVKFSPSQLPSVIASMFLKL